MLFDDKRNGLSIRIVIFERIGSPILLVLRREIIMNNEYSNKFSKYMKDASFHLKKNDFDDAYEMIMKAMYTDPNAPEPQNLLGIWYEFKGNMNLARKHYRMAYVLNPIYKPSSVNLERVSTLFPIKKIEVDFGDEKKDENSTENKENPLIKQINRTEE